MFLKVPSSSLTLCYRLKRTAVLWTRCVNSVSQSRSLHALLKNNFGDANDKKEYHHQSKERKHVSSYVIPTTLFISGVVALKYFSENDILTASQCATSLDAGNTFSREEVSKHCNKETGVWIIFGHSVYDITKFLERHPGGENYIMLAAGSNVEPFWETYAFHKSDSVLDILKEYYIGKLREEDWDVVEEKEGPFASDPKRHPALIACSKEPYNAETPPVLAVDKLITPNELFFVRNHLPVPDLKNEVNMLVVEGDGVKKPIILSVEELKRKFKKTNLVAAIQCAGNRRSELNKIKQVKGLSWAHTAISNAEWGGVLLKDILLTAGVNPEDENVKHIHFEGADTDPTGAPYGASIPANRVFDKNSPVLIAFEMNGEELPRDHGYPLRVLAPGIVGARNVKWLQRIIVSDKEYQGHWQQNDYKPFSPNVDWDNVDFSSSSAIQELPVTSAICIPPEGTVVREDVEEVTVKGYAYSGGGRGIIRVDVTADGGKTWHTANLIQSKQDIDSMYSWSIWECNVPIPKSHNGKLEIMCKAVDSSCNTQPENVAPLWNLRGVLNNSWHRTILTIDSS